MRTASLLLLLPLALAAHVPGKIVPTAAFNTSAEAIPLDSRVDLDFGADRVHVRQDGTFEFFDVQPGQHVVRALVPGYKMSDFIVTVPDEGDLHVQAYVPGRQALATSAASLPIPLQVSALARMEYYTPPPGVNIMGMLKSPMILLMLFSVIMAFALPKIQASIEADPELKKEMVAQRTKMRSNIQTDWSEALAGKLASGSTDVGGGSPGASTPSAAEVPAGARAATPSRGNGGQAKRGAGKRR